MSAKKDEMTNQEMAWTALAFLTIPFIGWWGIIPVLVVVFWVGANLEERKKEYKPYTGYKSSELRERMKWEEMNEEYRERMLKELDELKEENEPKINSWERDELVTRIALTDHAKRTLVIRHGVISPFQKLEYGELTPIKFKESDDNIYVTKFEQLNKSKEFAVALDENKEVILTFYPATNIRGHDAYFKKHKNLDNALKDDVTKSLEDLQKIWLDKIA